MQETHNTPLLYPSTCNTLLHINSTKEIQYDIYTITGKHILSTNKSPIMPNNLPKRTYILIYTELKSNMYTG